MRVKFSVWESEHQHYTEERILGGHLYERVIKEIRLAIMSANAMAIAEADAFKKAAADRELALVEKIRKSGRPEYYYRSDSGSTIYNESTDPEVTCGHCGKTFLTDAMDAACRMCDKFFRDASKSKGA